MSQQYRFAKFAVAARHCCVQRNPRQIAKLRQRLGLEQLRDWRIKPSGTLGYNKAEVTLGGVDTRTLSSKTMAVTNQPNLYFIGEVVDVTGHLGGFNFQWAWASGHAAGIAIADRRS